MLVGWLAICFCAYLAALYALACFGERTREGEFRRRAVYVLSSCVYCSSWSYCGSIGIASKAGLDFLPLYLGPMLAFAFLHPALGRIIRLAKSQKNTSIADFVAARYGKSATVAAMVTLIATICTIPYISLQLRAITQSLAIFEGQRSTTEGLQGSNALVAILVTCLLAILTMAIGTRRLDATEHQRGLMLVIAFESIVKIVAFVVVGVFVCWGMFKGVGGLTEQVGTHPKVAAIIDKPPDASMWISLTITTMACVFFLPRQFHASVVENRNHHDVRVAAWFVPIYLIIFNAFVLPIAAAGLLTFPAGAINREFTVLALPIHAENYPVALIGLLGSVAAATSMVLVATTALAVMVSNDLIVPFLLRHRTSTRPRFESNRRLPILLLRRVAIIGILGLSLLLVQALRRAELSSIGLMSLAGIAQIMPATIGGLLWERGTGRGAIGGMMAGGVVLGYTMLLPAFVPLSSAIVTQGPLGIDVLRPTDLFGLDLTPYAQGLLWSLFANILAYVAVSVSRPASANERLQASFFVSGKSMALATSFRLRHSAIRVDDLLAGVSRYLDPELARREFLQWHESRGYSFVESREADAPLIHHAERLIASSIGAASARSVLSRLLPRQEMSEAEARQMVDEAAFEIQDSRDVLQHAIDVARDGMAVYDADLRLVAWNRAYWAIFDMPVELMRVGTSLDMLVRHNAERGLYGEGSVDDFISARLEALTQPTEGMRIHSVVHARVYDVRSVRLHNGGLFFTYSDATAQATSEEQLEAENITLERRVHDRAEELERLNTELIRAKAEAEDANISKSRFLAAASHDLLQPLSAARLYMTSLRDRLRFPQASEDPSQLAANVDESLEALEDILGALLEISHLDAGATKTEFSSFCIGDLLRQLQLDFAPLAQERGVGLRVMPSSLRVLSDRKLLRRLLQNLISNAVKYTPTGRVLIGARPQGDKVRVEIYDTGIGIPVSKQMVIFREFERLPAAVEVGPGAGLGLSIVERLARVLNHLIALRSVVGRGTLFTVTMPQGVAGIDLAPRTVSGNAPRQRSLEGLVVAAIDNEVSILTAIGILLKGWDCVVASATGLAELESSLHQLGRAPDIIIADYHIGDIDGLAVVAALRERYGACPAVLVTADRSPVVRDMANAADVRVLYKPLKPAALRALLSQWHLVKATVE